MADKPVIQVTPNISQLLTTKERVSCTETGCNKTFAHDGALRMHLVKSHGLIKNDNDKCLFHGRKTETVTIFNCPVELCQYSEGAKKHFTSYGHVKQHYLKVHAERSFTCEKCNTGFTTQRKLQQHLERCGVLYKCATCSVKYTTKEALLTHCKRQQHIYPEEYAKKEKEKKKQNVQKKSPPAPSIVTIVRQPVLLIAAPTSDPNTPKPVRNILCKPPNNEKVRDREPRSDTTKVVDLRDQGHMLHRQDALIQTDIYGVNTLALSKDNVSRYNMTHRDPQISYEKFTNVPKKFPPLKRRISCPGDQRASSPRRKKMKSSTGIQTAVSLTKKKGTPMVSSTQTTGDYIIETAMRQANIHIEKKTVALQVTPQKSHRASKARPVLVDSYSQVKQQNIFAETSHNLAESQTMTDMPPSISTQTLQSYLVNQQELRNNKRPDVGQLMMDSRDSHSSHFTLPNQHKMNRIKETCANNTMHIYDESLHKSVKYVMPDNISDGKSKSHKVTESGGNVFGPKNVVSDHRTQRLSSLHHVSEGINGRTLERIQPNMGANTSHEVESPLNRTNLSVEESYLIGAHHTMDMGAQTMSASEFDTLLQSSGIFLNNHDFLPQKSSTNFHSVSTGTLGNVKDSSDVVNNLDFLSPATSTIDMNTQTSDLNLFENLVPIDSNTQTGGGDFDFLDMVMTNMETQTLNDDDLVSLGLVDASLIASPVNSQGVGYSSRTGSEHTVNVATHQENQSKTTSTSTSTEVLTDLDLIALGKDDKCDNVDQSPSGITKSPVSMSLSSGSNEKVNVQIETQTVSVDFTEPLMQTETQTQVESTDTDFEMMNMETQTTFDDLQQLSDWFHH